MKKAADVPLWIPAAFLIKGIGEAALWILH